MSDKSLLEEYFVWEERSLTGPPMRYVNNGSCDVEDTTKGIVNECVEKNEIGTKKKRNRNREYLRRKYKKRNVKILLKRNGCNNIDEYTNKKLRRREERREYKVRYKRIHYLKYISKVHNKRCKSGHKIQAIDLWKLCKKQKMRCVLTGRKLNRDNISLDHIVPICKGGDNSISNLRFVHIDANIFKLDMSDTELRELVRDMAKTLGL
jgi:hypothetical protein